MLLRRVDTEGDIVVEHKERVKGYLTYRECIRRVIISDVIGPVHPSDSVKLGTDIGLAHTWD